MSIGVTNVVVQPPFVQLHRTVTELWSLEEGGEGLNSVNFFTETDWGGVGDCEFVID